MRIVLQRVKNASVTVEEEKIAAIDKGFLLLVGVAKGDTIDIAVRMAQKIANLRIFEDEGGKMNLSLKDTGGKVLSVPQFTLLASLEKGNRPGFDLAALPEEAKALWEEFNKALTSNGIELSKGEFAAHMEVSLINDGPVTLVFDSRKGGER